MLQSNVLHFSHRSGNPHWSSNIVPISHFLHLPKFGSRQYQAVQMKKTSPPSGLLAPKAFSEIVYCLELHQCEIVLTKNEHVLNARSVVTH